MAPTMLAAILQPLMLPLPSAMILPPPLGAWCTDAMLTSPRALAPVRWSRGCPRELGSILLVTDHLIHGSLTICHPKQSRASQGSWKV
jgi:hypothetical protein